MVLSPSASPDRTSVGSPSMENREVDIFSATRHGDLTEVTRLLKNNLADANAVHSTNGQTPLHVAAEYGKLELVELLIFSGADINAVDVDDETPLFKACDRDRPKVVKLLLDSGANPDLCNLHGFTPLMIAAENGYIIVADHLICAGANVHKTNTAGVNAEDLALAEGYTDVADKILKAMDDTKRPKLVRKGEREALVRPYRSGPVDDLLLLPGVLDHTESVHSRYLSLLNERDHELYKEMKHLEKKLDAAEAHRRRRSAGGGALEPSEFADHSERVKENYQSLLQTREAELQAQLASIRTKMEDAQRRREEFLESIQGAARDHSEAAAARYLEIQELRKINNEELKAKLEAKMTLADRRHREHLEEVSATKDNWNDAVESAARYHDLITLKEKIAKANAEELEAKLCLAESRHEKMMSSQTSL